MLAPLPMKPSPVEAEVPVFEGDDSLGPQFPTFEIDSAFQGKEGLDRIQKALSTNRPYAMAFVDMRMPPGWDGIETIGHIWKQCHDLQIVICTGFSDFSWHDLIKRFGHSDRLLILKKPFDMTEVRQVAYSLAEKWDLAHQAQGHLERLQKLVSERTAKLQEANLSLQRKIFENKQAERRLVTQHSIGRVLVESATLNEAAERIFKIVCENLDWDWAGLWLLDTPATMLRLSNSSHALPGAFAEFEKSSRSKSFESGVCLPGRVWSTGQPVWVWDANRDPLFTRGDAATKEGLHGAVAFPVWMGTRVFGVMEFLSRELRERDAEQLQTFAVLGASAGQFIERKDAEEKRSLMELQLRHAQKLESIGQLAAGIAHEINTPTQYIGDNIRFLQTSFADLQRLQRGYDDLLRAVKENAASPELVARIEDAAKRADLTFLLEEIPRAIEQSLDGVNRVARIVRAMKEFSHPGTGQKIPIDLNSAVETTLTVAGNEWKYVATVELDFDEELPLVPCLPGEFNQVILNIVVNAAQAIAEVVQDGAKGKGVISVKTRSVGEWAEIRIRDTGAGIPEKIRHKVFDPFFTTKAVGKGTGQGLAIAHAVIVDRHGGTISFESETGVGTVFIIRLPMHPPRKSSGHTEHFIKP
jgi:signal transduction histidine kinase/FixJ family two-component response regulator